MKTIKHLRKELDLARTEAKNARKEATQVRVPTSNPDPKDPKLTRTPSVSLSLSLSLIQVKEEMQTTLVTVEADITKVSTRLATSPPILNEV